MFMRRLRSLSSFTSAMFTQRKMFSSSLAISAARVELTGTTLATTWAYSACAARPLGGFSRRQPWEFVRVQIACYLDLRAREKTPERNRRECPRWPDRMRLGSACRSLPELEAQVPLLCLDKWLIPALRAALFEDSAQSTPLSAGRRKDPVPAARLAAWARK